MDVISKEQQKLADLEFEYNIARLSDQSEEIIRQAKGKYIRQLNKVLRLQKISSNEQKQEDSAIILEELI